MSVLSWSRHDSRQFNFFSLLLDRQTNWTQTKIWTNFIFEYTKNQSDRNFWGNRMETTKKVNVTVPKKMRLEKQRIKTFTSITRVRLNSYWNNTSKQTNQKVTRICKKKHKKQKQKNWYTFASLLLPINMLCVADISLYEIFVCFSLLLPYYYYILDTFCSLHLHLTKN